MKDLFENCGQTIKAQGSTTSELAKAGSSQHPKFEGVRRRSNYWCLSRVVAIRKGRSGAALVFSRGDSLSQTETSQEENKEIKYLMFFPSAAPSHHPYPTHASRCLSASRNKSKGAWV